MKNHELGMYIDAVLAKVELDFYKDYATNIWVTVTSDSCTDTMLVLSEEFSRNIQQIIHEEYKLGITAYEAQSISSTLHTTLKKNNKLEVRAMFKRVGINSIGDYYYKLNESNFVKYSKSGVEVVHESNVMFKPIALVNQPLPKFQKEKEDSLYFVREFLNLSLEQQLIVYTYILYTFVAIGSKNQTIPILIFSGEVSSGKTTALQLLREFLSPEATTFENITTDDSLVLLSSNSHLTVFDNVGVLKPSIENTLVSITENAVRTQMVKFKDNTPNYVQLDSILMLSVNEEFESNTRLLDRSILVTLESIKSIKSMSALMGELREKKPLLLGSLFTMLPKVLEMFNEITDFEYNSRFSDFVKFGTCVAECLSEEYDEEFDFLETFSNLMQQKNDSKIKSNDLINALVMYIESEDVFEGTADALNKVLQEFAEDMGLDYKGYASNVLTRNLNSKISVLKEANIEIEYSRGVERIIRITKIELEEEKEVNDMKMDVFVVPQFYYGCMGCENFDFNDGESCYQCAVIDENEDVCEEIDGFVEEWEDEPVIFEGFNFEDNFYNDGCDILVEDVSYSSTKTKKNRVFNTRKSH